MNISSQYASGECVLNDFFRHSLDDSQTPYLIQVSGPSLNAVELLVIHNCPRKHSSQLQLSIRFTPSRCLDVRQDWYPMYYPEGMKARVSPVHLHVCMCTFMIDSAFFTVSVDNLIKLILKYSNTLFATSSNEPLFTILANSIKN